MQEAASEETSSRTEEEEQRDSSGLPDTPASPEPEPHPPSLVVVRETKGFPGVRVWAEVKCRMDPQFPRCMDRLLAGNDPWTVTLTRYGREKYLLLTFLCGQDQGGISLQDWAPGPSGRGTR